MNRYKLLVTGYIRDQEKIHRLKHIPTEIHDIIFEFQQNDDMWDIEKSSNDIEIDQENKTITILSNRSPTAFGCQIIEKGMFKWKVKILEMNYGGSKTSPPYFGVIEDEYDNLEKYANITDWENVGYMLCGGTSRILREGDDDEYEDANQNMDCYVQPNNAGDIIEIILDFERGVIEFMVNGIDCGNHFKNIKQTKYRLAVGVNQCKGSKFALLTHYF